MGRHPRVLVTGASGQVGRALRDRLPSAIFLTRAELDLTNTAAIPEAVRAVDYVVHLAAMTDVDACEQAPSVAKAVNGVATQAIARAAHREGARTIFASTDYVFDGAKNAPYSEDDVTHPLNVYGATKLAGEHHVLSFPRNLVIRTSWVFGGGRNFVGTILRAAHQQETVTVVDDQVGRPTPADALAPALLYCMQHEMTGVIHVAGGGAPCSWADLAQAAIEAANLGASVHRVDTQTYSSKIGRVIAPRPPYSVLSLDKAKGLDVPLYDWRESLSHYVKERS